MRKFRVLAILVVLLISVFLVQSVSAAQCPAYSFTALDGSTVNNTTDYGKPKLLIFTRVDCPNCQETVSDLAQATWLEEKGVCVYVVDCDGASLSKMQTFANTYGANCKNVKFCIGGDNAVLSILRAIGDCSTSFPTPLCVALDASGNILNYTAGIQRYNGLMINFGPFFGLPKALVNVSGTNDYTDAFQVLDILNQERAANGLQPLTMDKTLLEVGMQRAAECSLYFSHTRPNGSTCHTVPGFEGNARAENIAMGQATPAEAMVSWMNSDGHRENILSPNYTSVGIGVFYHNGIRYWTQVFSSKAPNPATGSAPKQVTAEVQIPNGATALQFAYDGRASYYPKVYVGKTTQLGLQYRNIRTSAVAELELDNITFSSSDTSVAKVSSTGVITPLKAGTFTLTARSSNGGVVYSEEVTVAVRLMIIDQPKNTTAFEGKTFSVTVNAVGKDLSYTWYRLAPGENSPRKIDCTTNTYTDVMTGALDGCQLYCQVTDQDGTINKQWVNTDTITLTMKQAAKITTQPKNVAVASGKTAKVTVGAAGEGLKYTWYYKNKGDSKFTKTTSFTGNSYSITMNADRDGRQVYCVVKDKYGNTVKSKVVTLSIKRTAKITTQPASVEVISGKTAKVTLKATGDGLTYTWYYKNKGDSSFTKTSSFTGNYYSISMNADRDGRQVYCVVKDKYGNTVKSKVVTLTMHQPIKITTQPASVKVASGKTAKVTVKATGEGLTYTWYYKNKGATKFTKTSSFTGNSYTVSSMDSSRDGRQVYCVVTDKYGNTVKSNVVTLSIKKAAKITTQPKTTYTKQGATAKVTVKATGDGLKYTWYIKNAGSSSWVKSSVTTNTYSVKMASTTKNRQIYCKVTDQYGNTVKSNTVYLRMAATITTQPADSIVKMGESAKVTVKAAGDGLKYTWYIKNPGSSSWTKSSVTTNTYAVKMAASTKGRQVYCVVKDKYGNSVKSNVVTLNAYQLAAKFDIEVGYGVGNSSTYHGAFVTVTAGGGSGGYQYKYEVFGSESATDPALTKAFSEKTTYGYYTKKGTVNGSVLQITIKDSVGNQVVYRIDVATKKVLSKKTL